MSTSKSIPFCAGPDPDPRPPRFDMPANACDTHFHIFPADSDHMLTPNRSYTPPVASLKTYHALAKQLGTTRGVLIQPSVYAEDNTALVAATSAAPDTLRGVVTVTSAITDHELEAFHAAGVRGIRVNIVDSGGMPFRDLAEAWEFTARIAGLGWHIELLAHVEQIEDMDAALACSKVPVIFGHLGYTKTSFGVDDPGYQRFLGCLAEGRCWVKLTGSYRISGKEATPYDDVTPMAEALLATNSDRIVWGSDWPHPRHTGVMPNDGALLDQLADWGADAGTRHKILRLSKVMTNFRSNNLDEN
jgi:2-pyrone-4,6-dicarboxylate lactonase